MSNQTGTWGDKAVVIGASISGLLAACALSDHFRQVKLLERDKFPKPGKNRKGVPQGKHTHVLLTLGLNIMEDFLPGLTEDLTELGAVTIEDVSTNVRWFNRGGYHQPGFSGVSAIGVSRPTLEAVVRARVLALPNVTAIPGCNVLGVETTKGRERVTGVKMVRRLAGDSEEIYEADLVIDCSGRGSRSPAWLEKIGYQRPREEEIKVGIGYTSCFFHREPNNIPGIQGIVLSPTPPNKRLGVMVAQDGDRWVVTIGGYLGDHAPTNLQGFLKAAKNLPSPDIYHVIREAEPLVSPIAYKFPSSLRRHYERLTRFPEGYLVFGDALCSFNPIYAQGMTVAAMEARALREWLSENRRHKTKDFFIKVSKIIDLAWSSAVGNDLSYPEIEGPRTLFTQFINWYIDKLHIAAQNDAKVSIAFLKVINMVAQPSIILDPRIIWRVLKGNLRRVPKQKKINFYRVEASHQNKQ